MRKTTVTCDRCKKEINRTPSIDTPMEQAWQIQVRAKAGDTPIPSNGGVWECTVFNFELCRPCTQALGINPIGKTEPELPVITDPYEAVKDLLSNILDDLGVIRE